MTNKPFKPNKLNSLLHNKAYTTDLIKQYENDINRVKRHPSYPSRVTANEVTELNELLDFHKDTLKEIEAELDKYYNNTTPIEKNIDNRTHKQKVLDFRLESINLKDENVKEGINDLVNRLEEEEKESYEEFSQEWDNMEPVGKEIIDDDVKVFEDEEKKIVKVTTNNPVYKRINKQIAKGLKKYNTEVVPDHYSIKGWHEHLQEELTDGLTYNEIMLMKIETVIKQLELAYKIDNVEYKNHHIEHALDILVNGED